MFPFAYVGAWGDSLVCHSSPALQISGDKSQQLLLLNPILGLGQFKKGLLVAVIFVGKYNGCKGDFISPHLVGAVEQFTWCLPETEEIGLAG